MRKIRFAPGKGNQKLIAMYNDGAEVWDTKEVGSAPRVCTAGEAAGHRNCVFSSCFFGNEYYNGFVKCETIFFLKFSFYSISAPKVAAQQFFFF